MSKSASPQTPLSHHDILAMLPGKHTQENIQKEMLRVDHAGEYGAVHIYRGQADIFKHAPEKRDILDKILEMGRQEKVHLQKFNIVLPERHIRPSLLSLFWRHGGYAMGAITAMISDKSAMACTEAVETVIDAHYATQINYFETKAKADPLLSDLKQFQQDELDHKHEALENHAQDAPFYDATKNIIEGLCHFVIKIAHKI